MGMIRVLDDSFVASADMSAAQFQPVKLHTVKNQIALCAAATDVAFGVLMDKPKAGDAGSVAILGRHYAILDGTTPIAIGDLLGPGSDGTKLVKKATADYNVCARALEACSIVGQVGEVFLFGGVGAVFRTLGG